MQCKHGEHTPQLVLQVCPRIQHHPLVLKLLVETLLQTVGCWQTRGCFGCLNHFGLLHIYTAWTSAAALYAAHSLSGLWSKVP